MSVQPDSLTSATAKSFNLLQTLNQILRLIRESEHPDSAQSLSGLANLIGQSFSLDRCVILVNSGPSDGASSCTLDMQAEYITGGLSPSLVRRFVPKSNSEIFRLLLQGKPLSITDIVSPSPGSGGESEWQRLISSTTSKTVVAFPLMKRGELLGLLSMHACNQASSFTDEVMEAGEIVAEHLAARINANQADSDAELYARLFEDSSLPMAVVDSFKFKTLIQNQTMAALVAERGAVDGNIADLVVQGEKIRAALKSLSDSEPVAVLRNLTLNVRSAGPASIDLWLSSLRNRDGASELLGLTGSERTSAPVLLVVSTLPASSAGPVGAQAGLSGQSSALGTAGSATVSAGDLADGVRADHHVGKDAPPAESLVEKLKHAEELSSTLSRQLTWERWVRQIISKMHSTLDRDVLLQAVVDSFGRALGASRCLIVRTDGPAAPLVTHEYAEPDISPLGLGRTGQFPAAATAYFRHRVTVIQDLTALENSGELTPSEFEYFSDNGIKAMAGAPITIHGYHHGVIVILESETTRKWTSYELDMLEVTAAQVAVALGHSQTYLQLKDQLFNMNLLGNLTQQLTNTLELVSRGGKAEQSEERTQQPGSTPPLSLRELEVLKLIASGLANREIAQRLFLTESTVELHASRIRKKLKLKSRTALVKYACDNGLA